ncbi:hypothetical protein NC651_029016 [Populus alba x Populus x berolinensis]|nr:hypothetical protein NC651_029016 [Populus alba x Populus x berolinensis]
MLKFLSKVKIEFNALDPRVASCMEFLAQCNARKAKESNPACQVLVKRRTDDFPPQITVTFVNGVEEAFDATSTPAQAIRTMILEKGQLLETEQMFREAGEKWPVIIPEEELHQFAPGTKVSACWLYLFLVFSLGSVLFFSSRLDMLSNRWCVFLLLHDGEFASCDFTSSLREPALKVLCFLGADKFCLGWAKEGRREEAIIVGHDLNRLDFETILLLC